MINARNDTLVGIEILGGQQRRTMAAEGTVALQRPAAPRRQQQDSQQVLQNRRDRTENLSCLIHLEHLLQQRSLSGQPVRGYSRLFPRQRITFVSKKYLLPSFFLHSKLQIRAYRFYFASRQTSKLDFGYFFSFVKHIHTLLYFYAFLFI